MENQPEANDVLPSASAPSAYTLAPVLSPAKAWEAPVLGPEYHISGEEAAEIASSINLKQKASIFSHIPPSTEDLKNIPKPPNHVLAAL